MEFFQSETFTAISNVSALGVLLALILAGVYITRLIAPIVTTAITMYRDMQRESVALGKSTVDELRDLRGEIGKTNHALVSFAKVDKEQTAAIELVGGKVLRNYDKVEQAEKVIVAKVDASKSEIVQSLTVVINDAIRPLMPEVKAMRDDLDKLRHEARKNSEIYEADTKKRLELESRFLAKTEAMAEKLTSLETRMTERITTAIEQVSNVIAVVQDGATAPIVLNN